MVACGCRFAPLCATDFDRISELGGLRVWFLVCFAWAFWWLVGWVLDFLALFLDLSLLNTSSWSCGVAVRSAFCYGDSFMTETRLWNCRVTSINGLNLSGYFVLAVGYLFIPTVKDGC
jgi:hypothetical protein